MDERESLLEVVAAIEPFDALERQHRQETLDWLRRGAPIWRTAKHATPPEHLVVYTALVDTAAQSALLVDHHLSGLWLPPGGHVEVGEAPADAATREIKEELGIEAVWTDAMGASPLFVTRTTTVGQDPGHVDVSLWYVFAGTTTMELKPDPGEFAGVRWFSFKDIQHAAGTRFDPSLPRFVAKLERYDTR